MNPGGTGTNEVLSLIEAAERLALLRRRPDRAVLRALRKLEVETGRRILVASGCGRGRRYLVLGRELEAALDGDRREVSDLAEQIAEGVQRIEDRVQSVSVRVDAIGRRVDALERPRLTR